jgi:hypothetical protein
MPSGRAAIASIGRGPGDVMGDWSDHSTYVDFVRKNAPAGLRRSLLLPASKPYDAKKYPNIAVVYYSMPDWMHIFSLGPGFAKRPFVSILAEYRFIAGRYQDKVSEVLDAIAAVGGTGQALLKEIAANRGRTLRIMPRSHAKQTNIEGGYYNSSPEAIYPNDALAHVVMGTSVDEEDSYAKGAQVRDADGHVFPVIGHTGVGTGKGANVVLFYSPEPWADIRGRPAGPGFEADEVLFHELVHVSRQLRGAFTRVPVDSGYGNEDEYLATVLANLYLSEKQKPLRAFYGGPSDQQNPREIKVSADFSFWVSPLLPPDWGVMKDPDKFINNPDNISMPPRELMKRFQDSKQKDFFFALSHLPEGKPKFNPVRQFFRQDLPVDI